MKKNLIIILLLTFACVLPSVFAESDGRLKDRTIEIGLANLDLAVSNDFLSAQDIFQDQLVINLDDLKDGLKLDFNAAVEPIYFDYNNNDQWGFGLHTGVDAYGVIDLAGEMLTFAEAEDVKSQFIMSVFADVSVPVFFRIPVPFIEKIKFKVEPSLYYPVLYAKPSISYTYKNEKGKTGEKTFLDLDMTARIYAAGPFFEGGSFDLTATPGFDWALGAEFAISEALGLNKIPFLDFDIGVDFSGIPMIGATMTDYMEMVVGVGGGGKPLDILNLTEGGSVDELVNIKDPTYGQNKIRVYRPFKALAWANWRPFSGAKFLTLTPAVGFSVNQLYDEEGSFEGGLKARLDFGNVFIVTAGIGYYDRFWKNSIDLALNLRAFELDIGASLRAPEFDESWTGSGFGLTLGLKFGW